MHQKNSHTSQQVNPVSTTDSQRKPGHSLQADMITGWRPKMKIVGPMPLNFDNLVIDSLIKPLLYSDTSLYEIVYLGPRPRDTLKMHEIFAKNYHYKYQHMLFSEANYLKPFFHKFYSQFEPEVKRPYIGMNKNSKSVIWFDSCFESGNLDCAIRTRSNEFDLILRIDSNTAGHVMWYYFKVGNSSDASKTIRLNIVNLRKQKNFYQDVSKTQHQSLRPFVKRIGEEWTQGGENVVVKEDYIHFGKQNKIYASLASENSFSDQISYRKLSFDLELGPHEVVEVAYSIPYTYSTLLYDLKIFKQNSNNFRRLANENSVYLDIDKSNQSLSGLQIPYLKIMESENDEKKKKKKYCVFIVGRQHPGEANSSHVLKGFIQNLLQNNSEDMKILRKQCMFYIIPMLNPDGVVMGNFRTSLYGKDLNRLFKKNRTLMIPEVQFCRQTVLGLSKKFGNKFFMFLDFHGHSVRRNAFFFAPSFLDTNSSQDIRQFPKLISNNSELFRYQSCSFRISSKKKTTARAVFSKFVGLCYTLQASNWSYFSQKQKQIIFFNEELWNNLGQVTCSSLAQFISNIVYRIEKRKEKKNQKEGNQDQQQIKFKKIHIKTKEDETVSSKRIKKKSIRQNIQEQNYNIEKPSRIYSQVLIKFESEDEEERKNKEQSSPTIRRQIDVRQQNLKQVAEEKSQEGDDSDGSEEQDMQADKFKKFIGVASHMMMEFQKVYYGDEYEQKRKIKAPATKRVSRKKQMHSMQQACLRYQDNSKINKNDTEPKSRELSGSVSKAKISYSYNNKSIGNLDSRNKQKASSSQYRAPAKIIQLQDEDPKKQILSSLPRISVINYLSIEDAYKDAIPAKTEKEKGKPIFRIPKLQNHIKITRRY